MRASNQPTTEASVLLPRLPISPGGYRRQRVIAPPRRSNTGVEDYLPLHSDLESLERTYYKTKALKRTWPGRSL